MAKNYRAQLVGVFGCPVDENPTIAMQEAAFQAAGLNWRYLTLLVKPEDLGDAFKGLRAMNFAGINLTVPHKVEALKYVDELSEEVKLIGATNTVVNRGGRLVAYNTDGKGFVEGLRQRGVDLTGKRIVMLGAGGAARAIGVECALAGAAEIVIINLSASRGETLASLLNEKTECRASFIPWEGSAHIPPCDVVYEDIGPDMIVQDVIPNPADTLVLRRARQQGAKTFDGLSMLVCQGAIGYKLWTGQDAPVPVMLQALEKENQ